MDKFSKHTCTWISDQDLQFQEIIQVMNKRGSSGLFNLPMEIRAGYLQQSGSVHWGMIIIGRIEPDNLQGSPGDTALR